MSARTILKHLYKEGRMTDYQYERIDRCLKARQGKWIKVAIVEDYCWHYECDQCHERPLMDRFADYEEVLSDYCPNCGARMERSDEE